MAPPTGREPGTGNHPAYFPLFIVPLRDERIGWWVGWARVGVGMSPRQNPGERPRPTPGRDGADPRRSEIAKRDRFASYTPSCLSGREWLLARQGVEEAVFKANPVSSESVKGFASYLCQFLRRSTDWDRTRPPDLRALLTDEAIKAHCEQLAREGKSVSTRATRGACLRRMMRGLAGRPPEHSREVDAHRPPAKKPVDLWPVAAVMASCLAPGEAGRRAAAAVALQLGIPLPGVVAGQVIVADVNAAAGVVRVGDRAVAVLTDAVPLLRRAVEGLARHEPLLPDVGDRLDDEVALSAWLLAHQRAYTPLSVVGAAVTPFRPLIGIRLDALLPLLPESPVLAANAIRRGRSTVAAESADVVRALRDVPASAAPEALSMLTPGTPTTPAAGTMPQRLSRAALLRAAKAAHQQQQAAADPLLLATPLTELQGWRQLSPDVKGAIADYTPKHVDAGLWRQVEDLARRIMIAAAPKTPSKAKVLGSHLAHYLTWTASQFGGDPLSLAELVLDEVTFRQYEHEGQQDARPGTRATRRSEIRPALVAARPGPAPAKLPYRPVRPPYTRAEQAQHVRLARNQPTRGRRRALSAVVALGYGGGLDGHDLRWVRGCDVFVRKLPDGTDATCVRVRGARPRTVVIRAEYAPLLHEAVQLHLAERRGKTGLLLGQKPTRSNVSTVAFENAVTADGSEVAIEVARLRTTWLAALLSAPVPLAVLLQAAGLRSARPLVDLLPYAPLPDDDTATRLLQAQPGALIQLVGGTR